VSFYEILDPVIALLRRQRRVYAADYRNRSLTDERAQKLLDTWIAIDNDDAKRRALYVPKVMNALPPKNAARYLQIENEYRILIKYDLAAIVPLVP
jgi:hypothetical protein